MPVLQGSSGARCLVDIAGSPGTASSAASGVGCCKSEFPKGVAGAPGTPWVRASGVSSTPSSLSGVSSSAGEDMSADDEEKG
eukprot:3066695-Amphidinium_carterae.1